MALTMGGVLAEVTSAGRQVPLLFESAEEGGPSWMARAPGLVVSLSPTVASLWLKPGRADRAARPAPLQVSFRLLGTKADGVMTPELPSATRVNHLQGKDPAAWRTGVPTYGRVRVPGVYDGVDVVYYGNDRQLEYDFVVAPGADPRAICFGIDGASRVRLTPAGDLSITVGGVEFRQHRPVAYQEVRGRRVPVEASFRLLAGATPTVAFNLGFYDPTAVLVVDPLVSYVSYLGGGLFDACRDLVVDGDGNVYVVGETASRNFPVVNGIMETNQGGLGYPSNPLGNDAFVARFTPDGSNLVFATYLGGSQIDAAMGAAIDPSGDLWVCGMTSSPDFPTTANAWASRIHGTSDFGYYQWDAFLMRLSADGATIRYSTYLGGTNEDQALRVAVGSGGRVYVGGDTVSQDFPRVGATAEIRGVFAGVRDAFVVCLQGTNVMYSRLLGGNLLELFHDLVVTPSDEVWLVGETRSANLNTTNAYQLKASWDGFPLIGSIGFVGRLAADGSLASLGYFSGTGNAAVNAVALDADGRLYLAGSTFSVGNLLWTPDRTNAPRGTLILSPYLPRVGDYLTPSVALGLTSAENVFVARFDATGTNLSYATVIAGTGRDVPWRLRASAGGEVTAVGVTSSVDWPLVHPNQVYLSGASDALVFQLDSSGQILTYSTYLGGVGTEEMHGVWPRPDSTIWLAGQTTSQDWTEWSGVGGALPDYGRGETDRNLLAFDDGLLLRLGPLPVPELQLLSKSDGTLVISWPGELPTTYQLQGVVNIDWTNIGVANVGGKPSVATLVVTNTYTTNVVVTNVVGGVTNVVTNTFVTNVVQQIVTPCLVGGTNRMVTNYSGVPPADYDWVTLSNVGGTTKLLTNIQTSSTGESSQKTTSVVEVVVGGTNYYLTNRIFSPWTNTPVPSVATAGRHTVTLTNDGGRGFFRLRRDP